MKKIECFCDFCGEKIPDNALVRHPKLFLHIDNIETLAGLQTYDRQFIGDGGLFDCCEECQERLLKGINKLMAALDAA